MKKIKVIDENGNELYVLDPGPGPIKTVSELDGSKSSYRKLGASLKTDDGRFVSKSKAGIYTITETGEELTPV